MVSPQQEYRNRLALHRQTQERREKLEALFGNARVGVFVLAGAMTVAAFGFGLMSALWLIVPVVGFLLLVPLYEKARRELNASNRAMAYWDRGLARLEDRWPGQGDSGIRFLEEHHPYAADLDLFGDGSLFQLLCQARTSAGQATLANWLVRPSDLEEVKARQIAVSELTPKLSLREEVALLGADIPAGVDLDGLNRWTQSPVVLPPYLEWLARGLAGLTIVLLIGWVVGFPLRSVALISFAGELIVLALNQKKLRKVLNPVEKWVPELVLFRGILGRLETDRFAAPWLCRLQSNLGVHEQRPSKAIGELINLVDWLHAQRNQVFAPLALLLLWEIHFAFALERWRVRHERFIDKWLDGVGRFEAISCLASYSFENPQDPIPELVEEGPVFDGQLLGHPLMPRSRCVANNLRLTSERPVLIVSGSNMSGKSTYLRTAGINVVLALAGAPVRARSLRLSPLQVGATLRLQDSLQAGQSRFYAEISRVHQLVELAKKSMPLLFLFDEIFHGTNSHDRRLGAEGLVRNLIGLKAIGLVTTHDLALAEIATEQAPKVANVHFADEIKGGQLVFDYQVHPGIVEHSNALALMRAVGLDI